MSLFCFALCKGFSGTAFKASKQFELFLFSSQSNIYFADQGLETRDGTRGKRAAADRGPKIVVASAREYPFHEKTLHTATQPYAIAVNPRKG